MTSRSLSLLLELFRQSASSRVSCDQYLQRMVPTLEKNDRIMVEECIEGLSKGLPVSEVIMNLHLPGAGYIANVLKDAEQEGTVPKALKSLTDDMHASSFHLQQIKNALSYPLFVLVVFLLFAMGFPFLIQSLISGSLNVNYSPYSYLEFLYGVQLVTNWLVHYRFLILFIGGTGLASIAFLLAQIRKTVFIQQLKPMGFWRRIPFFRRILYFEALRQFYAHCAMSVRYHIPLDRTLQTMAGNARANILYEEMVDMADSLKSGISLSEAMYPFSIFDPGHIFLIQNAPSNEQLEETLNELSEHYRKQFRFQVNQIIVWFEPLFILGIGLFFLILFVAFPVFFLDYFDMPTHIGK